MSKVSFLHRSRSFFLNTYYMPGLWCFLVGLTQLSWSTLVIFILLLTSLPPLAATLLYEWSLLWTLFTTHICCRFLPVCEFLTILQAFKRWLFSFCTFYYYIFQRFTENTFTSKMEAQEINRYNIACVLLSSSKLTRTWSSRPLSDSVGH